MTPHERAALDAAVQEINDDNVKINEWRDRALAADATGYARGVQDAAGVAQRLKAQPCTSGKCTCWPTCEARKTDASPAEIEAAILALQPKEKTDAR
jgi:hypothetical protein